MKLFTLALVLFLVPACSFNTTPAGVGDEAVTQMAVTERVYREVDAGSMQREDMLVFLNNNWRAWRAVAVDAGTLEKNGPETQPSSRPTSRPATVEAIPEVRPETRKVVAVLNTERGLLAVVEPTAADSRTVFRCEYDANGNLRERE